MAVATAYLFGQSLNCFPTLRLPSKVSSENRQGSIV